MISRSIGLLSLAGILGSVIGGGLTDRLGRRKLILFGLVASALSASYSATAASHRGTAGPHRERQRSTAKASCVWSSSRAALAEHFGLVEKELLAEPGAALKVPAELTGLVAGPARTAADAIDSGRAADVVSSAAKVAAA